MIHYMNRHMYFWSLNMESGSRSRGISQMSPEEMKHERMRTQEIQRDNEVRKIIAALIVLAKVNSVLPSLGERLSPQAIGALSELAKSTNSALIMIGTKK